jgi:hypothetical protein
MDNILFNAYSIFSLIPTLVGIFNFKKMNNAVKFLLFLSLIGNTLMLISILMAYSKNKNTHFIFYINITFSIFFYTLFFFKIIQKLKLFYCLVPTVTILYLIIDYLLNGLKQMNVLPYIFIDIFVVGSSIYVLNFSKNLNKSIRFLLLILLIYLVYDMLFNFATSYFFNYLGDKAFNLIWNLINPIVGIIYYVFLSFGFYFAVQKTQPNFDEMPDFK